MLVVGVGASVLCLVLVLVVGLGLVLVLIGVGFPACFGLCDIYMCVCGFMLCVFQSVCDEIPVGVGVGVGFWC